MGLKALEAKEQKYKTALTRVSLSKSAMNSRVNLNIGGRVFTASMETFQRWENTYFYALLSGGWKPDEDGTYFIDRNPEHFDRILVSLRTGEPIDFAGLTPEQSEQLYNEIDYYQLPKASKVTWDPIRCDSILEISKDGRTVTSMSDKHCWGRVVARTVNVPAFQVRLGKRDPFRFMRVGYANRAAFQPNAGDEHIDGCFLKTDGGLVTNNLTGATSKPSLQQGDLITVHIDSAASSVSFRVNGRDYGTVHTVIGDDSTFVPCIELHGRDASVSLED